MLSAFFLFSTEIYSTFESWRFKFSVLSEFWSEFPHFMGLGVHISRQRRGSKVPVKIVSMKPQH